MNRRDVERRITSMLRNYASASRARARALVPPALTAGKLYEVYVLGLIARELSRKESLTLVLAGGSYVAFKSAPGPINRRYPWIEVHDRSSHVADLWTDVEFLSMSYFRSARSTGPSYGDYHELDILITDRSLSGRPTPEQIWLGAECKNTGYTKSLLKEILGIRRELSLLQDPQSTRFRTWPRRSVPARPAACLVVYSTDSTVLDYAAPGTVFGIDFFHEPL